MGSVAQREINKFEIRISPDLIKLAETISNDQNTKIQNKKDSSHSESPLNSSSSLEHFNIRI